VKRVLEKIRAQRAALMRFVVLGALSYALLLGGTAAGVELGGMTPRNAYGVMLTLVLAWNFFANRRFVFPASRSGAASGQAVRFVCASVAFRMLEYALVTRLMLDWLGLPYALAITLGTGGMLGVKYVVFSRLVFRPSRGVEAVNSRP
jgi:putative flippase GtrA